MSSLLGEVDIWVKNSANEKVELVQYLAKATVRELYDALGYDGQIYQSYLVTINNNRIQGVRELNEIVTSTSQPLTFTYFSCWVQFEEQVPVEKFCLPTIPIASLQNNNPPFIGFHKGKRVKMGSQIWSLLTSQSDPLIFKVPRIMVCIEGKKHDIACDGISAVAKFVEVASKKVGAALHSPVDQSGSRVTDIDKFIFLSEQENRCLYLQKAIPEGPCYHHSLSISQESFKNISYYSTEYDVYHHWFAMKVYDAFHVSPPNNDAREFSKEFRILMEVDKYIPYILGGQEGSYSSVFFRLLDRFLFPEKEKGCVLHQPVLRKDKYGHSNKPDGYSAKLDGGVPSTPILVLGFKESYTEYHKAFSESLGYFQSISTLSGRLEPMLVMPSTPTKLTLYLCWPINSANHATIKVCEVDDESNHYANFFAALKCAVDFIDEIKGLNGFKVEPVRGIPLQQCLKDPNVYKCDDVVYKLLDNKCPVPNVEMVKEVLGKEYLSEMTLEDLTLDKKLKLLKYRYIPKGSKLHLTLDDFKPIARALDKLHASQYVHSDVRLANMVFPDHANSKLILAAYVGDWAQ